MVTWALVGAQTFGGGLEPPALPLATGLPHYKPYETVYYINGNHVGRLGQWRSILRS